MMKTGKIFGIFYLCLLCGTKAWSQTDDARPGMKVEEFKKVYPGIIPSKVYFNEDLAVPARLEKFNGKWYLDFNHDSLVSVFYSDQVGMRAGASYLTAFDTLVKKYTQKMGAPAWKKISADTVLSEHRKRKENMDTIRVVCWETRFAKVIMGLYLTGNHKVKMSPQEKAMQNFVNADASHNYYQFNIHIEKVNNRGEVYSWELYPGLHVYKVMELKPAYFPNGIGVNGQWQRKETFFGLADEWSYTFKNSRLQWMVWNDYAGKQDKETFEKYLKATQGIIEQYTQKYGTPVIVTGDTKYRDPYKKQHWGYDVLKASWDMKTYTIVVEYVFMGGKGRYDLLLKIEHVLKNKD